MLTFTFNQFSATSQTAVRQRIKELTMELHGEMTITKGDGKTKRIFSEDLLPSEERAADIADTLGRLFARFNAGSAPKVMRVTTEKYEDTPEAAAECIMQWVLQIVASKKQGFTAGIPLQLSRAVLVSWQGRVVNLGKISGTAIRYDLMYNNLLAAFTRTNVQAISMENLRALSEATLPNASTAVAERSVTDERFEAFAKEQAQIRAEQAAARKAAAALPSGKLN